jgi:hypothetical protein
MGDKLTARGLLHVVALGFLLKAIIITSIKSLGHSWVSYMLLISCVIILHTIFFRKCESIPRYIVIGWWLLIHLFIAFFNFLRKNTKKFFIGIYFLFRFDFYVFSSISSIIELCNIILPNFQYFSLICYYIPLKFFDISVLTSMVYFPT